MNHLRTFALLAALTALFVGFGYMIGGPTGMLVAFALAAAMNLFTYWNADRIVLSAYRAQPADADDPDPRIRNYVRDTLDLADRAGLPRPKVYVIDNPQPNAFATGRSPRHAAVAATTGLLAMLDRREVRGVMAHELAHVRNLDTLTMTVTATVAGAISALANFALFFGGDRDRPGGLVGVIALSILGPLAAGLVQMAISRHREYEADRAGADISGDPEALASALEKIEAYARRVPNMAAENNPATAHLFIINPLGHRRGDNLFSTHPNTTNRVAALRQASGRPAPRRAAAARAATAVPVSGGRGTGPWG